MLWDEKYYKINSRRDCMNIGDKKKAQVWVETVIYTLIALVIIGLFLSFAKPKVEEIQDKAIIDQSVDMLEGLNQKIEVMVEGGAGNKRVVDIGLRKGTLFIDGVNNQLRLEIDSRYTYTQPGADGSDGTYVEVGNNVIATTKQLGKTSVVTLISNYSQYNVTYGGASTIKDIGRSSTPYKTSLENKGQSTGKTQIDFLLM